MTVTINNKLLKLTPSQALPRLQKYCAYQERCQHEVRNKLYSFGVYGYDAEFLISKLIEDNFLNEERFAIQYAGSKFRVKQWGKVKIKHQLKLKDISEYCIKKALKEIDNKAYLSCFFKLADKKWQSIKTEKNLLVKKRKTRDYLLSRGFENNLIQDYLTQIMQ